MGRKRKNGTQIDIIVEKVIKLDFVTASFIQRKLGITYLSAQALLEKLAVMGYVEKIQTIQKTKSPKTSLYPMKKLIFMIPTGGKTLQEMNETIDLLWPEIANKLNIERTSKLRLLLLKIKKLLRFLIW